MRVHEVGEVHCKIPWKHPHNKNLSTTRVTEFIRQFLNGKMHAIGHAISSFFSNILSHS
jgi:hypothetical protein